TCWSTSSRPPSTHAFAGDVPDRPALNFSTKKGNVMSSAASAIVSPPDGLPAAPNVAVVVPRQEVESSGYWQQVRRRLAKDPVTLVAAFVLLLIVLSAIFAPLLAPYDPYQGNVMTRLKPVGLDRKSTRLNSSHVK